MKLEFEHPIPHEIAEAIAGRFALLSEPMRIKLLDLLREREEASVQELAEALRANHANVSKHLNLLYAARIVGRRKEATRVLYRITDQTVFELCELVCGGLRHQLAELNLILAAPPA